MLQSLAQANSFRIEDPKIECARSKKNAPVTPLEPQIQSHGTPSPVESKHFQKKYRGEGVAPSLLPFLPSGSLTRALTAAAKTSQPPPAHLFRVPSLDLTPSRTTSRREEARAIEAEHILRALPCERSQFCRRPFPAGLAIFQRDTRITVAPNRS